MAIFSNIRQNRVLDAGPLFPSSYVWNGGPLYTEKFYRVKCVFFFDFRSFISSRNEIKEDHSKRRKVDNLNLHREGSFID